MDVFALKNLAVEKITIKKKIFYLWRIFAPENCHLMTEWITEWLTDLTYEQNGS